jgi:hypothetical protein
MSCLTMSGSARGSKRMSEISSAFPVGAADETLAEDCTPDQNKMGVTSLEGRRKWCSDS